MNKTIEKAIEINKNVDWNIDIPKCEIGDILTLNDIWDGNSETPTESISYKITDSDEDGNGNLDIWINYEFEVIEVNDNILETKIKITNIELI